MQKCEKCRARAATVFITRVVDKQSTQSRMCEECAREQAISDAWLSGAPIPPDAAEMPLEELLTELLTGAPHPDSFAPEEDKWSLRKLAAYEALHSRGEFSGDEDLADDADEMDDEDADEAVEMSPEEMQAALDEMEPEEREAVSQMLEALDEVQEHLENIMLQHAQDLEDAPDGEAEAEDDGLATLQSLFASELIMPPLGSSLEGSPPDPPADEDDDSDPFADDPSDSDPFDDDDEDDEEGEGGASADEPLLPSFLLPGFLGFSSHVALPPDFESESEDESKAEATPFKSAPSGRCPKCRTTWDRLREDGRVGCASCYEMFEEALGESMERAQDASQHIGKSPRASTRRKRRLDLLRARRDSRLALLRERLETALASEQFEEAAKLRDKIKVIESTIVDGSA